MAINYYRDGDGNNPYVPDFTDIDVEPADLAQFADLLDGDLKALVDTWSRLRDEHFTDESPSDDERPCPEDPNFAGALRPDSGDGIVEAREFRRAYFRTADAELMLMEDLIKGLEILRNAAREIHDGYVRTDAANAADVEGAFAAYEQWRVIDEIRQAQLAAGTDDQD